MTIGYIRVVLAFELLGLLVHFLGVCCGGGGGGRGRVQHGGGRGFGPLGEDPLVKAKAHCIVLVDRRVECAFDESMCSCYVVNTNERKRERKGEKKGEGGGREMENKEHIPTDSLMCPTLPFFVQSSTGLNHSASSMKIQLKRKKVKRRKKEI